MRACERSEMPSIEQEPLPRNALSSARLWTSPDSQLGHRDSGSRRLFTPASPCGPSRAGPPSTRPVANGRHASLSLGDACRLLQPETTREHTLRAFDPRTRVELSPRYSPAPTDAGCVGPRYVAASGPASLDLHAPACARRVPLAWTGQNEGRSVRVKASRALLDDVARALLVAPRAPGSPVRLVMRSGGPRHSSHRPRLLFDASPRRATPSKEPGCLLPRRNPYASGGWLLRARLDRGPVTPPPKRHCSGTRAPFLPFPQRLLLTRKALESARPTGPVGTEAPAGTTGRSRVARPKPSLITSRPCEPLFVPNGS
jgi:hypothetical protein